MANIDSYTTDSPDKFFRRKSMSAYSIEKKEYADNAKASVTCSTS